MAEMSRRERMVATLVSAALVALVAFAAVLSLLPGPAASADTARAVTAKGAAASAGAAASSAPSEAPVHYQGSFTLTPDHGPAGTTVRASGSGFAPDSSLTVAWNTVRGHWVIQGTDKETFAGRAFDPVVSQLAAVTTDGAGAFQATFVAPADYGFSHDVAVDAGGRVVNKAAFRVDPTVTLAAASGPVGTPIHLTMQGVGWADMENSWMVTYDDQFTGWLSAVTTPGLAEAVIPATGAPGVHVIRIIHGSFTVPFLNMQQSPRPDRPTFQLKFTITPGAPVLPPAASTQALSPIGGRAPAGSGPRIWSDPARATVGSSFSVAGAGFPAGASVALSWNTVVGNRVGGKGWSGQSSSLAKATAAADGTFHVTLAVPDDLGGPHRIEAKVGGSTLASSSLTITPSAFPLPTVQGPAGTPIVVHLKGVGWTATANIYTLVYDNGYLGYACGFNSGGDVSITLPAAGAPGWHFIDLYPAIYQGKDVSGVSDFRIPQLTYAADHPGEQLPAFHFAFQVTP